jgi:hypothetical protein
MHSNLREENFVTLFDSNFLPAGISLHASLQRHARSFKLWVLCMDETVERQLTELNLPNVSLIKLQEAETDRLLAVKPGRTRTEYCWTLTPFTPEFVFDRDGNVDRVTYIDADLFFFAPPDLIFRELDEQGKEVLITEHAYAPEYDKTEKSGKFCVQFMTFRRTPGALKVMRWWQDRCIEWCFFRYEDGKLGDQMYLNDWPERFPAEVHVLQMKNRALAPWNARHYLAQPGAIDPVFFHFHGFRILSDGLMRWYHGYRIGPLAARYYAEYSTELIRALSIIRSRWGKVPSLNDERPIRRRLLKCYYLLFGLTRYYPYSLRR